MMPFQWISLSCVEPLFKNDFRLEAFVSHSANRECHQDKFLDSNGSKKNNQVMQPVPPLFVEKNKHPLLTRSRATERGVKFLAFVRFWLTQIKHFTVVQVPLLYPVRIDQTADEKKRGWPGLAMWKNVRRFGSRKMCRKVQERMGWIISLHQLHHNVE